ncbi:hypothetical protein [Fusobacterium perfoetens]|uniref:hypothetical protein n=1 Tax=Fusobacterium perfoetens TaxID=852 RepID=UPI000AEEFF3E|nr:hypothetical protein [Fusobacterium perfoetens]MCI6152755.1 hypothetical protein [Fusobacterium perfoetens]MDY3236649.1 hypothetical protein [Fusobacterium perfoetens]
MELENYQKELNKILKGCDICKAKMCNFCPNGKRKKFLKEKIKKLSSPKKFF